MKKIDIFQLSQEWDSYNIAGCKVKRRKILIEKCTECGAKKTQFHIFGCSSEPTVCTECKGRMIDCQCDPDVT